jgi:hypothetical protein
MPRRRNGSAQNSDTGDRISGLRTGPALHKTAGRDPVHVLGGSRAEHDRAVGDPGMQGFGGAFGAELVGAQPLARCVRTAFGPSSSRRSAASWLVSPAGLEPSCSSTSSGGRHAASVIGSCVECRSWTLRSDMPYPFEGVG